MSFVELTLASALLVTLWGVLQLDKRLRREQYRARERYEALRYVMKLHGEQPRWEDFNTMSEVCRLHALELLRAEHPEKLFFPVSSIIAPSSRDSGGGRELARLDEATWVKVCPKPKGWE